MIDNKQFYVNIGKWIRFMRESPDWRVTVGLQTILDDYIQQIQISINKKMNNISAYNLFKVCKFFGVL